jgi:nucleoside-diphosphate-sugar epimerase
MNIFVTGCTGFIGSHLGRRLAAKGFQVFCLVRNPDKGISLRKEGIIPIFGDIREKAFMKSMPDGIDIVYHLAGILGKWNVADRVYYDVHMQGTENLLNACVASGIKRFVFCSSVGVLGPSGNYIFDENSKYNPTNIYELTKAESEKMVLNHSKNGVIDATIIRPAVVYGPGDFHMLGLFKAIKKGLFPVIDKGRALFQPVYVEDVVKGLEACIHKNTINHIYILAGGKPVTVGEFATLISGMMNTAVPRIKISKKTASFTASICEILGNMLNIEPPLTHARMKFFTENKVYSINKAIAGLEYEPVRLEDGLKITIDWYVKNGYL